MDGTSKEVEFERKIMDLYCLDWFISDEELDGICAFEYCAYENDCNEIYEAGIRFDDGIIDSAWC